MRIVLDTNVFVSALFSLVGPSGQILDMWRTGRFELVVSGPILEELRRVTDRVSTVRRLDISRAQIDAFVSALAREAVDVEPVYVDAVPRDPSDNLVLGTAIAAGADKLVTGDEHLLALVEFRGVPILTPRQFLALMER